MKFPSLVGCALGILVGCAGTQIDKTSPQYAEVKQMGASELRCPPEKVKVTPGGESVVVAEGCGKSTTYVLTCRNPGQRERDYLKANPMPPSDEAIEALAESGKPEDSQRALELRQQQIAYKDALVQIRLEDLKAGELEGTVPRHKLRDLPEQWAQAECRYEANL